MRARPASLPAPAVGAVLLVAFLARFPPLAAQQQVRGTVLDADSRKPVAGTMVVLLHADERPVGRALTSADGSFRLAVPAPGRYRLRIDRIGYASTLGPSFDVAAGETVERDVVARVRPVELRGLEAEGARRCEVRPAEGLATARVWEEARKALAAAQWTEERELYRFSWERYTRNVAPGGQRILNEERASRRRFTPQPFEAADAGLLAREGFVRRDGDEVVYDAPDAGVLLSDAFLDTHCLVLEGARPPDSTLIGLRFEPVPGRRLPEVAGVLWLEADGARLRSLEYRYVNLEPPLGGEGARGELGFRELPDGTWIVREWRIRMPSLAEDRDTRGETVGYRVIGFRDEGGVVDGVVTAGGDPVPGGLPGGVLEGAVTDSLGRPVEGARVRVAGTPYEALTGADGTFRFQDLGGGRWTVEASHPALTAVGFAGVSREIDVVRDETRRVELDLPSVRRVVLDRCGDTPPGSREAVLVGRVLDDTGTPVADADVRVLWALRDTVAFRRTLVRARGVGLETRADGTYLLCHVPVDVDADVWARTGDRGSDTVEVEVPRGAVVVSADVRLRPPEPRGAVPGLREAAAPEALRSSRAAAAPLDPADSLWLASKGFWLRRDEALLHETRREVASQPGDTVLSQVVARAPGVEVVLMATGGRELRLRPPGTASSAEACPLDVYRNGRLARQRESARSRRSRPRPTLGRSATRTWSASPLDLDGLVPVGGLTGIEVFTAAEAPVEAPGRCGAVLLWMRGEVLGDDPPFTGTLEGTVTCAPAGRPVAGAPVVLDPGGTRLVTDEDGRFEVENLPPARYGLDVEVPGWGTWHTEVGLRAGSTVRVGAEVEGGCG